MTLEYAAAPPVSNLRAIGPWYLAEFLLSYAITLFTACAYFFAQHELGATPGQRLWISASWGFIYIFVSLGAGHLSEKWGPRRLVLVMAFLAVAAYLSGLAIIYIPAFRHLWALFVAMMLVNLTASLLWPPIESAITRSPGNLKLSTRLSLYNLTWGSSNFAAFFTGPLIFEHGWSNIFLVPAVVNLVGAILVATLTLPGSMLGAHHVADDDRPDPEDTALLQRNRKLLYMAWVANAMAYVAINVVIPVLPTVVVLAGAKPGVHTSFLASAWTFTRTFGFFFFWRWAGWHYSVKYLLGMFGLMILSFIVMLAAPWNVPLLFVAEVGFGLAIAMLYSASLYYAMHTSSGSGSHAGIHEALIGLGVCVGPAAGALAGAGDEMGKIAPPIIGAVSGILFCGLLTLIYLGRQAGPRAGKIPNDTSTL